MSEIDALCAKSKRVSPSRNASILYEVSGDLHSALQTELADKKTGGGVEFTLVKLRDGREDIRYSLHGRSSTWTSAGLQTTDALTILGFQHFNCPWSHDDGYCAEVRSDFDLAGFAQAFAVFVESLRAAERHLESCGIFHPTLTGERRYRRVSDSARGDGHRSPSSTEMKRTEDENFVYVFSWIEGGSDKGWVTHYRPKHEPLSSELQAAFDFLQLNRFAECPWFEFEACFWRFTDFERAPDGSFFDSNAETAHRWYDSHADNFSAGLQKLIEAHTTVESYGFSLLPQMGRAPVRFERDLEARLAQPTKGVSARSESKFDYDVAISFSGSDRSIAERLAQSLQEAGYRVFYDDFYPEMLWGKDLTVLFDEIYRVRSRYCVILISEEYVSRMWTTHERKSAVARQLEERGAEYILPIQVDDTTDLPGVPPTLGRLTIRERAIEDIAKLLIAKLGATPDAPPATSGRKRRNRSVSS